jgi:hypothetical protein
MNADEALEVLLDFVPKVQGWPKQASWDKLEQAEAVLRAALSEGIRGWAMPPKHIYGDSVIRVYLDRPPRGSKPVRVVEEGA